MYNHIIHLEGADKTGKDTVRRLLVQKSLGQYLVYVRSFISQIAYSRLYGRKINEDFFWERFVHAALTCDEKFFILFCTLETAELRFVYHNESHITLGQFDEHQDAFMEVANEATDKYDIKITQLSTSHNSPELSYKQIQKHLMNDNMIYCNECNLCSRSVNKSDISNYALGTGKLIPDFDINHSQKYFFVGMNPSNDRVKNSCHPFEVVGTVDKNSVFKGILEDLGILNQIYFTNSVKCSTENNKINQENFNSCLFHLKNEIEIFQPEYLIALGSDVYHLLYNSGIFDREKIIRIYHPSYQYAYQKISAADYRNHIADKLSIIK